MTARTELAGLYARYKGLALAVGAGLLLDEDGGALTAETLHLAADAGRAREAGENPATCALHEAALALHRLAAAELGAHDHDGLLADVRATHRALRAELWDDVAQHYAPCGAHVHRHPQEHAHG